MTNRIRMVPVLLLAVSSFCRALDSSAPSTVPSVPTATAAPTPLNYQVAKGESIWDISHKFHCSVTAIKAANGLKKNRLKTGQMLEIPSLQASSVSSTATTALADKKHGDKKSSAKNLAVLKTHHHFPAAQPVQDFDIPTSTFASCPAPPSNGSDEPALTPDEITPVAPAALQPEASPDLSPVTKTESPAIPAPIVSTPSPLARGTIAAPSPTPNKSFARTLADFFGGSRTPTSESGEWGNRFLAETRDLASHGIGYNQSWRPEGEAHSWVMDCSNTSRYLYQVTAGIQLPRTASDQYYYLHLQNKAWDVPTVASGFADCNFLRSNLKPGDLLFWENTYRPDRQPPITHVMIFLGTNEKGQWIMAGSQSSHGGQYNPHRSGPDVYVFDPTRPSGGYTTWLGLVRHKGRFCAYGRPLEADVKKLSVAADD